MRESKSSSNGERGVAGSLLSVDRVPSSSLSFASSSSSFVTEDVMGVAWRGSSSLCLTTSSWKVRREEREGEEKGREGGKVEEKEEEAQERERGEGVSEHNSSNV